MAFKRKCTLPCAVTSGIFILQFTGKRSEPFFREDSNLSALATYVKGDVKAYAMELSEQIRNRMEYGIAEIPDELIQKAEIIVHQVGLGFECKR